MGSRLDTVMRGRVWKFGDSIDTNQLTGLSDAHDMETYKAGCLVGIRPEFSAQAQKGDLLVAGTNFGTGSSRQSAVEVLDYIGIQAVLAESIARIYFRTGIALAYPLFIAPGIGALAEDGEELEVNYQAGIAKNVRTGASIALTKYPPSVERIFAAGGLAPLIAQRLRDEGIATES